MSWFSAVDGAPDPGRLIAFLDHTAGTGRGMKHYAAAVLAAREVDLPVLDIGCGVGHDLTLLSAGGLRAVGVDPSAVMLREAARRMHGPATALVQSAGERLPFRDGVFGGCRMERVLMHVHDPAALVGEAVRCLAPGSTFTMYEPDWSAFRVTGDAGDEFSGWIVGARHPGVGGALWRLVEDAGCEVLDRVEELSVWRSLDVLDRIVGGVDVAARNAVVAGRVDAQVAEQWLHEQRARDRRAAYLAFMPKILVIARRP